MPPTSSPSNRRVSHCETGCAHYTQALYLQPGNQLGFEPLAGGEAFTEYVSDPARGAPFRARPFSRSAYAPGPTL
jgi:uncharacterized protein